MRQSEQSLSLSGLRVLVVEDEFYIADDLRRALGEAGAEVVGPAPTVERARALVAEGGFDCAVLDLNLHGESGTPVAALLTERAIPFVIATGYGSGTVPEEYASVPRCEKPFDPAALVKVLKRLNLERVG